MKRIIVLTALMLFGASIVLTQQTRKIDFNQLLVSADDKPILMAGDDGKSRPVTLGDAAILALTTTLNSDAALSGEKKFELFELAHKIYKSKSVSLSNDELLLLKDRIGKVFSTTVAGAAWTLIDPDNTVKVPEEPKPAGK